MYDTRLLWEMLKNIVEKKNDVALFVLTLILTFFINEILAVKKGD